MGFFRFAPEGGSCTSVFEAEQDGYFSWHMRAMIIMNKVIFRSWMRVLVLRFCEMFRLSRHRLLYSRDCLLDYYVGASRY